MYILYNCCNLHVNVELKQASLLFFIEQIFNILLDARSLGSISLSISFESSFWSSCFDPHASRCNGILKIAIAQQFVSKFGDVGVIKSHIEKS